MTFEHTTEPDCLCDSCCAESARRMEIEREAREAYAHVSNFLNGRSAPELVKAITRDHRTLQSCFMQVCVAFIEHYATLTEGQYDLRNQAAAKLAKAIPKTEAWQEHSFLPYI